MVKNSENSPTAREGSALGCASCNAGGAEARGSDEPGESSPTIAIRYGFLRHVGEFTRPPRMVFRYGARVVIRTQRGVEIGERVSLTCSDCPKAVTRDQLQTYIANSGESTYGRQAGGILREAGPDDLRDEAHIRTDAAEKRRTCQEMANQHGLDMKVVECEHIFGGERIIFYFMAEGRVDFRSLVRDLARAFRTRIEMRQFGARDEARLLADFETCGRECCCKTFLKDLKPVSMKMAKIQKSTLDPSKVSGRCGRLKCCLRYEHLSYQELDQRLPRVGASVYTNQGEGIVTSRQVLTQLVQLRTHEGGTVTAGVEDILSPEEAAKAKASSEADESSKPPAKPRDGRHRPRQEKTPKPRDGEPAKPAPAPQDAEPATETEKSPSKPKRRRRRRGRRWKKPKNTDGGAAPSGAGPPTPPQS